MRGESISRDIAARAAEARTEVDEMDNVVGQRGNRKRGRAGYGGGGAGKPGGGVWGGYSCTYYEPGGSMILFPLSMRWRRFAAIGGGLLVMVGCGGGAAPSSSPPRPEGTRFYIIAANASRKAERVQVMVDGRVVVAADVAGRSRNAPVALDVSPGWHRIETATSGGARHRAMVDGNRTKWIRVQREPSKPEGVGVHVTEYPQR